MKRELDKIRELVSAIEGNGQLVADILALIDEVIVEAGQLVCDTRECETCELYGVQGCPNWQPKD